MAITRERFDQGMTLEEYKAQMTQNREAFAANEAAVILRPEDVAFFEQSSGDDQRTDHHRGLVRRRAGECARAGESGRADGQAEPARSSCATRISTSPTNT